MALRVSGVFKGITVTDAYARLTGVSGGKHDGGKWRGCLAIYASAAIANPTEPRTVPDPSDAGKTIEVNVTVEPAHGAELELIPGITADWVAGSSPEALLYAAAKQMDRFSGAVEV